MKYYQIGDFTFKVDYPQNFIIPSNFQLFEVEERDVDYSYTIELVATLPETSGNVITERIDAKIIRENNLEKRYLGIKNTDYYYALVEELDNKHSHVYYLKSEMNDLTIDPLFTSLFMLERRLINYDSLILHCAYLKYNDEAILFSAPSETGKTTQAKLWEQYTDARQVNGDRGLLQKKDNQWYVRGWPVCGTSEICHNEDTPIKAIVMLSQEKENKVEILNPMTAFKLLYSQVTINKWNKLSQIKAMDLVEELMKDIPIYHLGCTISKEAVDVLKDELYKNL